ncbi:hypothetical protein CHARACLAT_019275 [Characodon lateralis]|uniref:Uncharacterized protein n=1 Tax=Characodon lateralis TaxID=208331 RepID=A0ABU7DK28_9TELE|nr:hypothetical protein [Characodon lateralis]
MLSTEKCRKKILVKSKRAPSRRVYKLISTWRVCAKRTPTCRRTRATHDFNPFPFMLWVMGGGLVPIISGHWARGGVPSGQVNNQSITGVVRASDGRRDDVGRKLAGVILSRIL